MVISSRAPISNSGRHWCIFGKDTELHPEIFPFSLAAAVVLSAAFEISLGFIIGSMSVHRAPALDTLALLGSSAIMFSAGLETDPGLIARTITRGLAVGLLSFAGPSLSLCCSASLLADSTSRVAVEEEEVYLSAEVIGHYS